MNHNTEGVTVTLPIEEYNKLVEASIERIDLRTPEMYMFSAVYQISVKEESKLTGTDLFIEAEKRVRSSPGGGERVEKGHIRLLEFRRLDK